jgi:hypothetical protein
MSRETVCYVFSLSDNAVSRAFKKIQAGITESYLNSSSTVEKWIFNDFNALWRHKKVLALPGMIRAYGK